MLYRTVPKTGEQLSALGFGCMRYPSKNRGIDEERTIRQIRHAIDNGINYFDTAPVYHMGKSEPILAKALQDGYREKVKIATKLPHWSVRERADMDRILSKQLATLQTDHIDYYLLHSLAQESWERLLRMGVLEFLEQAKATGKIKNAGFSFHGNFDTFKTIVDGYDWQFCQIQYNLLDEHNQAGTAGLRYAAEKRLAVMVMEPLRGGSLAGHVPDEVQMIYDQAPVKRSPAEWALRWVLDHPEVTVVLSGMNEVSQIDENIRTAGTALPRSLLPEDRAVLDEAKAAFKRLMKVGCTGCGYCMPCPAGVDIPGCFALYNARHLFPKDKNPRFQYIGHHGGLLNKPSNAGLCRECGKCEKACPQHLPIPKLLKNVKADMEGMAMMLVPVLRGGLWCMNAASGVRSFFAREKTHE
jgi:hypothetical protein